MENLPFYISLIFGLTAAITVFIFYKAAHGSKTVLLILLLWMIIQTLISQSGFYTITQSLPPRFFLATIPPLLAIIILFASKKGRHFIASLDSKALAILHTVRIPVEIVLLWLFINKTVPEVMTFEGRNFDILSGLSAPVIYYLLFIKRKLSPVLFLLWNVVCIGLLINIVTIAILSAPFPFQQLGFDQPNIAVLYFPFIWLPAVIVPLVLFSHLASIYQIVKEKKYTRSKRFPQSSGEVASFIQRQS